MGRTACAEPQCLYKGDLYLYLYPSLLHFIITLFNVGNVLLCVIYQLNFTVFMYFTQISRYITLHIAFGIIRGFT